MSEEKKLNGTIIVTYRCNARCSISMNGRRVMSCTICSATIRMVVLCQLKIMRYA